MTDLKAKRKNEIDRQHQHMVDTYPKAWRDMIRAWRETRDHSFFLLFAANALFASETQRWALDPINLKKRLPAAQPPETVAEDLSPLDFILLTHNHADHADPELWRCLSKLNCCWIVPEHMRTVFNDALGEKLPKQIVYAQPEKEIRLPGARILPFDSWHWEPRPDGSVGGVPAYGYQVEVNNKRWLYPGDIRNIEAGVLRRFAPVDVVWAQVFLGRSEALAERPSKLEAFTDLHLECEPGTMVLTHLYDARPPADCWCRHHAEMVAETSAARRPRTKVLIPDFWQETKV